MTHAPTSRTGLDTPHPVAGGEAIDSWLDRLIRLTRLPGREASEIREELDAHLRERVRDLMLAGTDEAEAVHKSISELGDLAVLAGRYRAAQHSPRRRLAMNIAIFAGIGAALGLGGFALQRPAAPESARELRALAGAIQDGDLRLELTPRLVEGGTMLEIEPILSRSFDPTTPNDQPALSGVMENTPLSDAFTFLGEAAGRRVFVHWRQIGDIVSPDTEITELPLDGQTLDRVFMLLNDVLGLDGDQVLAYRQDDSLLEVSTREFFDRRETELRTYDVSSLTRAEEPLEVTAEAETLVMLITQLVEPDSPGASLSVAGGKLFVHAPPRIHELVEWMLAELSEGQEHSAREEAVREFLGAALQDDAAREPALLDLLSRVRTGANANNNTILEGHIREAIASVDQVQQYPLAYIPADAATDAVRGVVSMLGGEAYADVSQNTLVVKGGSRVQHAVSAVLRMIDLEPSSAGK